jgi:hypothetical protein
VVQAKLMGQSAIDKVKPVSPAADSSKGDGSKRDVMLVHGRGADGSLKVLRAREDRLELGSVGKLEEGKPIHGEVVRLTPRKDAPFVCDVETQLDCGPQALSKSGEGDGEKNGHGDSSRAGPAQVASESYRENWDLIWKRPAASEMN